MPLHMITDFDTPDFDSWCRIFEGKKIPLAQAGLHPLRILHLPQTPAHVWIEFDVEDESRAEQWLDTGLLSSIQPFGPLHERHRFLETH